MKTKDLSELGTLIQEKKEQEFPSIVLKFTALNKGVKITDDNKKHYTWEELIDENLSIQILKSRVIELNKLINALEPGINSNVAFFHTTKDNVIPFTWEDTKEFIIAAIKYRMQQPYYKKLVHDREIALQNGDFATVTYISRKIGI